jgi:hypothetical protein
VEDGVGPDLPDHQGRLFRKYVGLETQQFLVRFLAASAPVKHVDHEVGKPVAVVSSEIHFQAVRIRHNIAPTRRRGRSDRHDPDRPPAFDCRGEMRKAVFQTDEFGRNVVNRGLIHLSRPFVIAFRGGIWDRISEPLQTIFAWR